MENHLHNWEDEGGLIPEDDDDLLYEEEFCPRCGEPFEVIGSPCVYCEFDPLYD
jgi:predicted amidophosphoribosyltransferase